MEKKNSTRGALLALLTIIVGIAIIIGIIANPPVDQLEDQHWGILLFRVFVPFIPVWLLYQLFYSKKYRSSIKKSYNPNFLVGLITSTIVFLYSALVNLPGPFVYYYPNSSFFIVSIISFACLLYFLHRLRKG